MKQVVVIHGAGGFASMDRTDAVAFLKKRKLSLDDMRRGADWKANLQSQLGPNFDVLQPRMPDADQPYYEYWKVWLERIAELLDDEVILVGHSLGGLLLAKYLAENTFPKKVASLHLVAAPYTGPEVEKDLTPGLRQGGWLLPADISNIEKQCGTVHLYHSTDDPVVPYSAAEGYQMKLRNAKLVTLEGCGHVRGETLPELVEAIQEPI